MNFRRLLRLRPRSQYDPGTDSFSRPVANGWGTKQHGEDWAAPAASWFLLGADQPMSVTCIHGNQIQFFVTRGTVVEIAGWRFPCGCKQRFEIEPAHVG